MPRKINLMIAVLLASGAIAQPQEEAVLHVPGRSSGTTAIERNVDRKTIRSGKENKDPFKKLDRRSAARDVWVKGRLLVIDDSMNDVEMIVEVQEGQCRSARLKKNGRFDVVLPAGSRARLIFQKPGHIIKEVLVDATGLSRDPIIRGEDRKVDFDVILVPEEHIPGSIYAGPVGSIVFRKGSGAMKVEYHERLVAVEDGCPRRK